MRIKLLFVVLAILVGAGNAVLVPAVCQDACTTIYNQLSALKSERAGFQTTCKQRPQARNPI